MMWMVLHVYLEEPVQEEPKKDDPEGICRNDTQLLCTLD